MNRPNRAGIFAAILAALALLTFLAPAQAQEISESHLKAARGVVSAIHASDPFDIVLPAAGSALKKELIQKDPDIDDLIIKTVDEQTLALVSRRSDIEKEAALAYARAFTEAELVDIAAFYSTDTGKKLIAQGPMVMREIGKSGSIWQRGVARDLAEAVAKALQVARPKVDAKPGDPVPTLDTGAGDDAPAESAEPAQ